MAAFAFGSFAKQESTLARYSSHSATPVTRAGDVASVADLSQAPSANIIIQRVHRRRRIVGSSAKFGADVRARAARAQPSGLKSHSKWGAELQGCETRDWVLLRGGRRRAHVSDAPQWPHIPQLGRWRSAQRSATRKPFRLSEFRCVEKKVVSIDRLFNYRCRLVIGPTTSARPHRL